MRLSSILDHAILITGSVIMTAPVLWLGWELISAVGIHGLGALIAEVWGGSQNGMWQPAARMMGNSLVLALGVSGLICLASMLAAYALVMFRVPAAEWLFGAMLLAMFFPIESRILPTFGVIDQMGLLNSYAGIILPVTATGLGVLVLRIYLQQLPPELFDAARLDGAKPLGILRDIVVPLSLPMLAALFAITFVLGWNQYVWPIMVTTTSPELTTLTQGMAGRGMQSPAGMVLIFMALFPPALVVLLLQRWLVRGLTAGIH